MKQMRIVLAICAALMLMITIPAASAITVDGVIGDNEWDDNWAFGQTNNATAASEYDIFDVGDRLEVRQGGFGQDTTIWNAEDPKADAGTAPDFGDDIAQAGDSSGMDLLRVYGHYNATEDTFYGLATVYGTPGDSDGDGNLDENCSNWNDCNGIAGPASAHPDQIGMGPEEVWRIRISQSGSPTAQIEVSNNNWTEINGVLDYDDIDARFNPTDGGVYEIAVTGVRDKWDIGPCQEPIKIEVQGSVEGDGPGEDTATAFVKFPCPDVEITKYVSSDNSSWEDANTAGDALLVESNQVYWKYEVTNNGDEPLTNVEVTDDKIGSICTMGDLGVGDTAECYADGSVPEECPYVDGDVYRNEGTVNSIGLITGVPVDDMDPAHYRCPSPDIEILKYVSKTNESNSWVKSTTMENGSAVYWKFVVTNTGDEPLEEVEVNDNQIGFVCDIGDLGMDDSQECYANGVVPTPCEPYTNTATADGVGQISGIAVTDSNSASYNCEPPNDVPTMTPIGLVALIGMLGFVALRRRD
ncbi:VPXXXP-CTERM sorting domain-containing protein [Methanohalophilus sp.]